MEQIQHSMSRVVVFLQSPPDICLGGYRRRHSPALDTLAYPPVLGGNLETPELPNLADV